MIQLKLTSASTVTPSLFANDALLTTSQTTNYIAISKPEDAKRNLYQTPGLVAIPSSNHQVPLRQSSDQQQSIDQLLSQGIAFVVGDTPQRKLTLERWRVLQRLSASTPDAQ